MYCAGYLEIRMQKLNFVPTPTVVQDTKPRLERLEVMTEREKAEMDFSKICENYDLPPDLEPLE